MEVQDLRDFIAERFLLNDRVLDERFKNVNLQLAAIDKALSENSEHHIDLKDYIEQVQTDLNNVKNSDAIAKERSIITRELEQYKAKMENKYSILRLIEKYPKMVLTTIAVLTALLMTGDITGILKLLGVH